MKEHLANIANTRGGTKGQNGKTDKTDCSWGFGKLLGLTVFQILSLLSVDLNDDALHISSQVLI